MYDIPDPDDPRAAVAAAWDRAGKAPPARIDPLTAFLQGMPPDQLEKILGAAAIDPQEIMLQQQLQRTHALRMQAGQRPAYGALAGVGQGLANVFGAIHEGQLEDQQRANIAQRQSSLDALVQALRGGGDGS